MWGGGQDIRGASDPGSLWLATAAAMKGAGSGPRLPAAPAALGGGAPMPPRERVSDPTFLPDWDTFFWGRGGRVPERRRGHTLGATATG